MVQIRLSDIPDEGLDLECELDASTLDLEESGVRFKEPIRVQFRLLMMDQTVYLSGQAEAPTSLECVRCLDTVSFPFHASFQMNMEPQQSAPGNNPGPLRELHRQELDEHTYSGDVIDLSELVREQILLALPTYPLCRADCRGLCTRCGADLNHVSCRCTEEEARTTLTPFQQRLKRIIKK
jgi:DUF177 domain-containing protein